MILCRYRLARSRTLELSRLNYYWQTLPSTHTIFVGGLSGFERVLPNPREHAQHRALSNFLYHATKSLLPDPYASVTVEPHSGNALAGSASLVRTFNSSVGAGTGRSTQPPEESVSETTRNAFVPALSMSGSGLRDGPSASSQGVEAYNVEGHKPEQGAAISLEQLPEDHSAESAEVEELSLALLHVVSKSQKFAGCIAHHLINSNGHLFVDPDVALKSMMRALHVVKDVLQQDGHVYVVNSNPMLKPIVSEAANCCLNANVWFYNSRWVPGTLTNAKTTDRLFKQQHQPNRKLVKAKGLRMTNVHCAEEPIQAQVAGFSFEDHWELYARSNRRRFEVTQDDQRSNLELLKDIIAQSRGNFKFKVPGSKTGRLAKLQLLVILDPTFAHKALVEAHQSNIVTISPVNHYTDLSTVTYPVYARDNNPRFAHFFMEWLMRVVNLR